MRLLMFWHAAGVEHYHDRFIALSQRFETLTIIVAKDFGETKSVPLSASYRTICLGSRFNHHPSLLLYKGLFKINWSEYDVVWVHEELHSLSTFQISFFCSWYSLPFIVESAVISKKVNFYGLNLLERFVIKQMACVCYRNDEVKKVLSCRGVREDKFGIKLFNGVSAGSKQPDSSTSFSNEVKVGFVGRILAAKGVLVLAEALASLNLEIDFIIAGKEVENGILDQAIQLYPRTYYRGELAYDSLVSLYKSLDILVLPSIPTKSWTEQFGRVLCEAIVHGTFSCGSRIGAIPEIVGVENTFEANNANDLKNFLSQLLVNRDIHSLWIDQYENVLGNYTWQKQAELMFALTTKYCKVSS